MTSLVVALSDRQLDAYNRADLDAFCACFHDDVVVLAEDGSIVHRGIDAFRRTYAAMFAAHREVHATVDSKTVEVREAVRSAQAPGATWRSTIDPSSSSPASPAERRLK